MWGPRGIKHPHHQSPERCPQLPGNSHGTQRLASGSKCPISLLSSEKSQPRHAREHSLCLEPLLGVILDTAVSAP